MSDQMLFIVFRVANFFVLAVLFVYLFLRYALPAVKGRIDASKREAYERKQEKQRLAREKKALQQARQEQDAFCRHLYDAVEKWNTVLEQRAERREKEKQEREKYVQQRVARQQKNFKTDVIAHEVVPKAAKQAQEQLQECYANEHAGRVYIKAIIQYLRKRSV